MTTSLRFGWKLLCLWLLSSSAWAVTLNWVPPEENVNGTPLTDLAGYRIYYGIGSRDYTDMVDVADPALTTYEVCLAAGSYYFAMTALDEEGNESAYSNEVLKVEDGECNDPPPLPPGGVAAVDDPVYIIVQSEDTLVLLDIGTMSTSTACDPDVAIRDDNGVLVYKVPRSAVTPYSPSQEMVVVFSTCTN